MQTITIHHNHITEFNDILLNMVNLEYLYISCNEISELPLDGWENSPIKVLDLESNSLYTVPVKLFKNSKVHNLNIKDNHILKKDLMNMEGIDEY